MVNFMQFFKEEKDIFIQNVAKGQISLQFGKGENTIAFMLPRKRDPIVLTNHVPFQLIKESTDFRKMISRQPAVIKIFTEEEYTAYYQKKAKIEKVPMDQLIQKAEAERMGAKTKIAPPASTAPKEDSKKDDDEMDKVTIESTINHRVEHLCHQASGNIPEADRMKPADLLAQLKDIADEFSMDDFEYILAHTTSKSIHKWAKEQQKHLAAEMAS